IDREDDAAGMVAGEAPYERRVFHGGRAEHDASGAQREVGLEALARAHAAADLDARTERVDHGAHDVSLHGSPVASALEIHHVEPGHPAAPGAPARGRIVVVYGDGVVTALLQPHGLAAEQIDGGDDDHEARNLSSNARPARWLFSGWNW